MLVSILGTAFLCGVGGLLTKFCSIRTTREQTEQKHYLLITQDYYDTLKTAARKNLIAEQPALPDYSEKGPLLNYPQLDIAEN